MLSQIPIIFFSPHATCYRFSSDANIQKALGMITDLCGFISLTGTLWSFGDSCYNGISRTQEGFSNISV